jgi:RNA polymerase sigma factor (sigma-70 family)
MKNITILVKDYLKTKNHKLLQEIFALIEKPLFDKTRYIYYVERFYVGSYRAEEFNKKTKKFQTIEKQRYIRLQDTHEIEFEDVLQSLKLYVIQLFSKWEQKVPFEHYLMNSLKHWKPTEVRSSAFKKEILTLSDTESTSDDGYSEFNTKCIVEPEQRNFNKIEDERYLVKNIEKCFKKLNHDELRVIQLLKENSNLKQTQIADIIGVTPQRINQIFKNLRKKYKGTLDF